MQFVQAPQSGKTFYLFEHIKSQDRPFYILVLPQVLPWLQCFLKKKTISYASWLKHLEFDYEKNLSSLWHYSVYRSMMANKFYLLAN